MFDGIRAQFVKGMFCRVSKVGFSLLAVKVCCNNKPFSVNLSLYRSLMSRLGLALQPSPESTRF